VFVGAGDSGVAEADRGGRSSPPKARDKEMAESDGDDKQHQQEG
jgi:hypothetical protein